MLLGISFFTTVKKEVIKIYQKTVKYLTELVSVNSNLTAKEKDRIRFAIEIVISTLISLITSLILAKILGIFIYVLIILLTGALLKVFAGGIHLKTIWECALSTSIISNGLGLIAALYKNIIIGNWFYFWLAASIFILYSLYKWSPAEVPENPIKDEKKRKLFHQRSLTIASIILVIIIVFPVIPGYFKIAMLLGLIQQSIVINPLAYKFLDTYYKFKNNYLMKGGEH